MSHLQLKVIQIQDVDEQWHQGLQIFVPPGEWIGPEELRHLVLPDDLNFARGVILYGRASNWFYGYLVERCQNMPWVASFDLQTRRAVIITSQVPEYAPGDTFIVIPPDPTPDQQGQAIFIGGPPNSGKSVFCHALYCALQASLDRYQRQALIHRHSASWDGEGNWYYETDKTLADPLRSLSKRTALRDAEIQHFFQRQARVIANIRQVMDLVLVDVGGRPTQKLLIPTCTHYILVVAREREDHMPAWIELCEPQMQCVAVIYTVLEASEKVLETDPHLILEVGPFVRHRPARIPEILIQRLIELLPAKAPPVDIFSQKPCCGKVDPTMRSS